MPQLYKQSWKTGNSVTFSKIYISPHFIEIYLWNLFSKLVKNSHENK